jgi:hypothetical protein
LLSSKSCSTSAGNQISRRVANAKAYGQKTKNNNKTSHAETLSDLFAGLAKQLVEMQLESPERVKVHSLQGTGVTHGEF